MERAKRRLRDEQTAARLAAQGIDCQTGADVAMVDLATMGEIFEHRGPALRRWCVFEEHEAREQRRFAALVHGFVERHGIADERVLQLRLRPRDGMLAVGELRQENQAAVSRLADRLSYISRRSAASIQALAWAVHHRPVDDGALVDMHFHVAVLVSDDADLDWLKRYCGKRYDMWLGGIDEDDDELQHVTQDAPEHTAGGLGWYMAGGVARHVSGSSADTWSDENLAEYVRQTQFPAAIHRRQTLGPLRVYAASLKQEGLRHEVRGDAVVLAPIVRRSVRIECSSRFEAGPSVVALNVGWIGEELRPVAIVKGWSGDWADLARRYDLSLAVQAARAALGLPSSSYKADTPESLIPDDPDWRPAPGEFPPDPPDDPKAWSRYGP